MSKSFICPVFFFLSGLHATLAFSQCAPGIPSAGNQGCIPQDQSNSPYYRDRTPASSAEPDAVWEDRWGAVVLDSDNGRAGTIEDQPSKSAAIATAMDLCAHNGGTRCELQFTFYNQCAAIAQGIGGGKLKWSMSPDKIDADTRALQRCGGKDACQIVYSQCSMPKRIR
ncbi:DUF4189 domain-containing protein [Luteibacter yeojuensis]